MAQIKELGSSSYTTINDNVVAAALMNPANNYQQDNILKIGDKQYQFNTLIMGSSGGVVPPVSIGSLTFTEVNAEAAATSIVKTFANAIPAGKMLSRLYGKGVAFTGPGANIEISSLASNIQVNGTNVLLSTQNVVYGGLGSSALKIGVAGDLILTYSFAGGVVNPKNYTAGSIELFVELMDAPTL